MKIAISEIKPKAVLNDLDSSTSGEIIGGKIEFGSSSFASAIGDLTNIKTDSVSKGFAYENDYVKFEIGGSISTAFASAFTLKQ